MQDGVDRTCDVDESGDVEVHETEARLTQQVRDVVGGAGEQIVDADDFPSLAQKVIAEMGPDETGPSGDQDAALLGQDGFSARSLLEKRPESRGSLNGCQAKSRAAHLGALP
jgi:hypothetical protein